MKMLSESQIYRLELSRVGGVPDYYDNVRCIFRDEGYLIIKFVDGTIKSLDDTDIIGYKLEPLGRLED